MQPLARSTALEQATNARRAKAGLDWLTAGHRKRSDRTPPKARFGIQILDRYVLGELAGPFAFAIAAFTLFMLINTLFLAADYVINKGIPFGMIMRYLVLQLPTVFYLILPFGVLFCVLLGIGRLAGDNEITALRTSGVSLQRLALPCYVFGILMTMVAFAINEDIAPRSQHKAAMLFREIVYHSTQAVIQPYQYYRTQDGTHVIYVMSVESGTGDMHNVQIWTIGNGYWPETITARLARQSHGKIIMVDGFDTTFKPDGSLQQTKHFGSLEFPLGTDLSQLFAPQSAFETNSKELRTEIKLLKNSGQDVSQLEMQLQQKYAMPVACMVSLLIALPLAIRFGRRGRGVAAMLAVLVLFAYYLIMVATNALGKNGAIWPPLAAWLPNIAIGGTGLFMLFFEER